MFSGGLSVGCIQIFCTIIIRDDDDGDNDDDDDGGGGGGGRKVVLRPNHLFTVLTLNKHHLHRLNFSCVQKSVYDAGISIFNDQQFGPKSLTSRSR
jgi:hypothetical protein